MKFITIKKRTLCAVLMILVTICSVIGLYYAARATSSPKAQHTIVIDAGHGGRDGGTVGKTTGVSESKLNLDYALELKSLCQQFGFEVVLTRSSMDGLYDESASNKKKSEMEKRRQIINNSGADLMISLHMNSFPLSSASGAQVFYAKGSSLGFELAKSVQNALSQNFENARDYVSVGDYFVLNYSEIPACLVECGFLSNPEEEKLLQTKQYRQEFCYSVLYGIISYFDM